MTLRETPTDQVINVNRLIPGITTLGPGTRFGLWVQGCPLACSGCASVDTWDSNDGKYMPVDDVAEQMLNAIEKQGLTGITLTGGEPVNQSRALAALLDKIASHPIGRDIDTLMFTGYSLEIARKKASELFSRLDTVVAGPYRRNSPSDVALLASSNQVLVHLTDKGTARHRGEASRDRIQLLVANGELTLVGLPGSGDLERFQADLAQRGVVLKDLSWQL